MPIIYKATSKGNSSQPSTEDHIVQRYFYVPDIKRVKVINAYEIEIDSTPIQVSLIDYITKTTRLRPHALLSSIFGFDVYILDEKEIVFPSTQYFSLSVPTQLEAQLSNQTKASVNDCIYLKTHQDPQSIYTLVKSLCDKVLLKEQLEVLNISDNYFIKIKEKELIPVVSLNTQEVGKYFVLIKYAEHSVAISCDVIDTSLKITPSLAPLDFFELSEIKCVNLLLSQIAKSMLN